MAKLGTYYRTLRDLDKFYVTRKQGEMNELNIIASNIKTKIKSVVDLVNRHGLKKNQILS